MTKDKKVTLSPTVSQVIEEFMTLLRNDEDLEDLNLEALQALLSGGPVPKAEEITEVLFSPAQEEEQ